MSQQAATTQSKTNAALMEKIVSLCKRRGFVFQSSEIYGGLNGCWDYGPLGVELKRNLKDYWWRRMTRERDDVVGLDGSILMNRRVWQASGHEATFSDPMVDCLLTKKRLRADQVEPQSGIVIHFKGYVTRGDFNKTLGSLYSNLPLRFPGKPTSLSDAFLEAITQCPEMFRQEFYRAFLKKEETPTEFIKRLDQAELTFDEIASVLVNPKFGYAAWVRSYLMNMDDDTSGLRVSSYSVLQRPGESVGAPMKTASEFYLQKDANCPLPLAENYEPVENTTRYNPENGSLLTEPRAFNLMLKTNIGATEDEGSLAYLRPETAQAIFVQFKNVLDTTNKKLPFGIAQIGKAFRNEINPRNFTFRSREFEQMELEYFCRPEQGMDLLKYWLDERLAFYEEIGLAREKLHVLDVPAEERAHYSKGTYDIEYEFPFGVQELEGVAYRTDYDLKQHQEHSGKPLEYFDDETKEHFIPHVVEPSAGVDRTVLALLCEAYAEETITDDKGKSEMRVVLRFHPRMAPVKVGVFPLLKNKPELVEKARSVAALLKPHMNVVYSETGAIGKRYRKQDEVGTPFCLTVDFETLGERGEELRDTVTLRHRDSMQQERIKIADLPAYLLAKIT